MNLGVEPDLHPVLTYVVPDLHGRYDLLRSAMAVIGRHAARRPFHLVFLGDYIDRGPESRLVIEGVMSLRNEGRVTCLLGNHERMLLRQASPARPSNGAAWLAFGGSTTLQSYGLDPTDASTAKSLPAAHLRWLMCRPTIYTTSDRIYVHAGIAPGRTLAEQGEREHLWIREDFLTAQAQDFQETRHIVHGHTPQWLGKPNASEPELLPHRTNLDTGAYLTNVLAVGVFVEGVAPPVEVLSVTP